jgi:hypothetical protein
MRPRGIYSTQRPLHCQSDGLCLVEKPLQRLMNRTKQSVEGTNIILDKLKV